MHYIIRNFKLVYASLILILISEISNNELTEMKIEAGKNQQVFNYRFIRNPENSICGNSTNIDLLVYVHSSPSNFNRRNNIRKSWANRLLFPGIRLIFILGSSEKKIIGQLNQEESNKYGDIIQSDFLDNYRNLTLKSFMAIRWVYKYCHQAKFVLKTDDDVIVS